MISGHIQQISSGCDWSKAFTVLHRDQRVKRSRTSREPSGSVSGDAGTTHPLTLPQSARQVTSRPIILLLHAAFTWTHKHKQTNRSHEWVRNFQILGSTCGRKVFGISKYQPDSKNISTRASSGNGWYRVWMFSPCVCVCFLPVFYSGFLTQSMNMVDSVNRTIKIDHGFEHKWNFPCNATRGLQLLKAIRTMSCFFEMEMYLYILCVCSQVWKAASPSSLSALCDIWADRAAVLSQNYWKHSHGETALWYV